MKEKEKIKTVLEELYEVELDKERKHVQSSIEPRFNGTANQSKYLDTLARLLTGKDDTCVAICYDKEKEKILVASNRKEPEYAKLYLATLASFVENQTTTNYEKLLGLSVEQLAILLKEKGESFRCTEDWVTTLSGEQDEKEKIDELKEVIGEYGSNKERDSLLKIKSLSEEIFKEIKELKEKGEMTEANRFWSYLAPLEDNNIIAQIIKEKILDFKIIKAIRNPKNIDYLIGEENIHAEMKIIDKLRQQSTKADLCYIGISKLSCLACQTTIDTINRSNNLSSGDDYEFTTRGTHGGTYPNWIVPDKLLSQKEEKELVNKLERIREGVYSTKVRESTSIIPQKMADFVFETNIQPSFPEPVQLSFTNQEIQDWVDVFGTNFDSQTNLEYINWLVNIKKGNYTNPEWVLNNANLEDLKQEFQQYQQSQLQTLQVQPAHNN